MNTYDPAKQAVIEAISAGFIRMTMLDGHPANNRTSAYSASWWQIGIGSRGLRLFQSLALDPDIEVPGIVDYSEAFYQNTKTSHPSADLASYEKLLNLWGVLPVSGKLDEKQLLTGYMGHGEVPVWYKDNVEQLLVPGSSWFVLTQPKGRVTIHPTRPLVRPDGKPHFEWGTSDSYTRFGMSVSQVGPDSSRSAATRNINVFTKDDISETSFTLPEPLPQGTYSVTVRGIREDDSASEWSAPFVFYVTQPPVDLEVSTAQTTIGTVPLVSWPSVEGAEFYVVTLMDETTGEAIATHATTEANYVPTFQAGGSTVSATVQAFNREKPLTYPSDSVSISIPSAAEDTEPPASSVLSAVYANGQLNVTLDGSDDGTGIAFYDVYYAIDDGDYLALKLRTTETTATVDALPGHQYSFISLASDWSGNPEVLPEQPDVSIALVADRPGDIDGDDDFDANDSFLIHLAMLSGTDTQIDQSKGGSQKSALEIRSALSGLFSNHDVDGDGDFDANDSFLTHLVMLSGSNDQIDLFKGASPLSAAQIRANIGDLSDTGGGSIAGSSSRIARTSAVLAAAVQPMIDVATPDRGRRPLFEQPSEQSDARGMLALRTTTQSADFAEEEFRRWIDAI